MATIDRGDWQAVVERFRAFFEPLGTVEGGEDRIRFDAPMAGTGLEIGKDGTSRSFMPLHDLDARWDAIRFEEGTVVLVGDGVSYTYRVPPSLFGDS